MIGKFCSKSHICLKERRNIDGRQEFTSKKMEHIRDQTTTVKGKIRDPRWLRIEVCRDHMRGEKCERGDDQCRFAHPDNNCLVVSGKVTACYDSMKGRCNRENCKYYHPPEHLKKYIQALGKAFEQQRMVEEQSGCFPGGSIPIHIPMLSPNALFHVGNASSIMQAPRRLDFSDKLPICCFFVSKACNKTADDCQFAHPPPSVDVDPNGFVTVCMDFISDRCDRENCKYFHPPSHLKARVKAMQLRHVPLSPTALEVSEPAVSQQNLIPVLTSTPPLVYPSRVSYVRGSTPVMLYTMPTPMGNLTFPSYGPNMMLNGPTPTTLPMAN